MRDEAKSMFERLQQIDWFSNCGRYQGGKYAPVSSKAEAIRSLTSRKWYNFSSVLYNGAGSKILPSFQRVEDYNQASLEVCGTATDEFIQRIETLITERIGSDVKVKKAIRGDISSIVWEAQFSHISPPFFYCPVMLPIYEMGHLPCGWQGPLPPENWKGDPLLDLPLENIRVF